jgi:hypothetical protein
MHSEGTVVSGSYYWMCMLKKQYYGKWTLDVLDVMTHCLLFIALRQCFALDHNTVQEGDMSSFTVL